MTNQELENYLCELAVRPRTLLDYEQQALLTAAGIVSEAKQLKEDLKYADEGRKKNSELYERAIRERDALAVENEKLRVDLDGFPNLTAMRECMVDAADDCAKLEAENRELKLQVEQMKDCAVEVRSSIDKSTETIAEKCCKLKSDLGVIVAEREALISERDEAREWAKRLQKTTQTLTCVYCGIEYPPGSPTHGSEVLTEHIRVCPEHPMRELEEEKQALTNRIENLECGNDYLRQDLKHYLDKSDKLLAENSNMLEALTKIEFYATTGCLQDSFDLIKSIAREVLQKWESFSAPAAPITERSE